MFVPFEFKDNLTVSTVWHTGETGDMHHWLSLLLLIQVKAISPEFISFTLTFVVIQVKEISPECFSMTLTFVVDSGKSWQLGIRDWARYRRPREKDERFESQRTKSCRLSRIRSRSSRLDAQAHWCLAQGDRSLSLDCSRKIWHKFFCFLGSYRYRIVLGGRGKISQVERVKNTARRVVDGHPCLRSTLTLPSQKYTVSVSVVVFITASYTVFPSILSPPFSTWALSLTPPCSLRPPTSYNKLWIVLI